MMEMDGRFWVAVLQTAVGAMIGGGGVAYMARLALTEQLRKVFAEKEDVPTKAELQEALEARADRGRDAMASMWQEFRQQLQNEIGPMSARMEREHEALRRDLERAIGALDLASRQLQQAAQDQASALGEVRAAEARTRTIMETYEAFGKRLAKVEHALGRMEERVSNLAKGSDK